MWLSKISHKNLFMYKTTMPSRSTHMRGRATEVN